MFLHRWFWLFIKLSAVVCAFVFLMINVVDHFWASSSLFAIRRVFRRPPFKYRIKDRNGATVTIVDLLLPRGSASLEDRAQLQPEQIDNSSAPPLLLMWDANFEKNLRGCADWNCEVTNDQGRLRDADAVFFQIVPNEVRPLRHQYFVHHSQESPIHAHSAGGSAADGWIFNMSFGFRMDTPAASPYGFTARLASESEPKSEIWQKTVKKSIAGKTKAMAWFVSNCGAPSGRDWVVEEMRRHGMEVDVFGSCGPLKCSKGPSCHRMLDRDYFFYFAAENSICKDYLTEKIWDQGLGTLSVPVILRRSLAQHLLPPNSFIAVDDFASVAHLAHHLSSLMKNSDKYFAYFGWRANFVVVPLNSFTDPSAERLFGVCQVCRLLRLRRRPSVKLPAPWSKWWDESCEKGQLLVEQLKKNVFEKNNLIITD
ncbi:hypothetical protein niasHT_011921 [Heterodera trifolii]|uniref:Fucosyltransferase n=1 Tax=Heterodera trifolii TaxID=157864 RepID=A0ABD2KWZ2_9BILA